ncbi:MAG: hypothetical protein CME88_04090 [Hirschia sp.]|nr:hypothetical protein [Hirschia sp.]MBF17539.1 hypothetical protein [Hirschia sp.]|tara:strand:+ start:1114 stop:1362 length:249 start_codon:yes stop_codon:yes gene_type:complete
MIVDLLGYVAMATGVVAALAISADISRRITGLSFIVFTISSVSWVVNGAMQGEPPLVIQNVVMTLINVFGIYRWLIRKKPAG